VDPSRPAADGPQRFDDRAEPLAAVAYRVAYRMLGDREEARDLAQEALARAYAPWDAGRASWPSACDHGVLTFDHYPRRVAGARACLVDVYRTTVACDFAAHRVELPALAGLDATAWLAGYSTLVEPIGDGRLTLRAAYELLLASARVYDDTIPFLEQLRALGVSTAIVSNCAEHTSALLDDVGISPLVDAVVLSCEVGYVKPDAAIFEHALERLGVERRHTVLVDDQLDYCLGARAAGLDAIRIERRGSDDHTPARDGVPVVGSLLEALPLISSGAGRVGW
jgi:HAD superfamily hydrolase (TIGR01509 family)